MYMYIKDIEICSFVHLFIHICELKMVYLLLSYWKKIQKYPNGDFIGNMSSENEMTSILEAYHHQVGKKKQ